MRDSELFFTQTKPRRLFFTVAIPGAVSMFMSSLYILVDGILVGNILGEGSFAALNLAFPFVLLNFSVADLIGVGSSVSIAIALGEKRKEDANNWFTCACIMIILCAVFMGGALFILAPWLFRIMGAEGELAEYAVKYLRVYAVCSPATTIVFAEDNFLRICGKIRFSMTLNIVMSILNAGFEFAFLFFLKWGVWAAALANCCGMFCCAVIALIPFIQRKLDLMFVKPAFSKEIVLTTLAGGSPNFLQDMAGRLTSIVLNAGLLKFGGTMAVSVYGILMYTRDVLQPILYGMFDALQPAIGYNWGAGNKIRIRRIEQYCFCVTGMISVMFTALLFFMPKLFIFIFMKDMPTESLPTAIMAMKIFSATFLTRWFSFGVQSLMTAIRKPRYASAISVSTALVFPLIWIALLWPFKLTGMWMNFPLTSLCAAILAIVILRRFCQREFH